MIFSVDILRIAQRHPLHHFIEGLIGSRADQEVHVIAHETVGQHRTAPFFRVFLKQRQMLFPVVLVMKNLFSIISPLNDVVRVADGNGPCDPWHMGILPAGDAAVNKIGCVPNLS